MIKIVRLLKWLATFFFLFSFKGILLEHIQYRLTS